MKKFKKIFVAAPGDGVTGGPELLHQLVHELRSIGHEAYVCYTPFSGKFECPVPYQHYEAPQGEFEDAPGNLLVVPEVSPMLAFLPKRAMAAIWWLSVDSYILNSGESPIRSSLRYFRYKITGRRPWRITSLSQFFHFAQSQYAINFLQSYGVIATPLSDYLNIAHLNVVEDLEREPQIAFNPKKGKKITDALISAHPQLRFVPIANLSAQGVVNLLQRSALYIDFGHHPGKDRLPREAALAGCCVITGRRGSADNPVDIPIPANYKLDESDSDFIGRFGRLAGDIVEAHQKHSPNFDEYRDIILSEKLIFSQQVRSIFE